jgi:hypothetical protein
VIRIASIIVIAAVALGAATAAQAVQVTAQAASQSIYKGDALEFYILIDGADAEGQVDTSPWKDLSPAYGGGRNTSQNSVTIINGKRTDRSTKQFIMAYILTPKTVGEVTIPSVTVKVDGQEYQTNPVSVRVLESEKTDKMRLEVELSDDKCYVGQSVLLKVKWYLYSELADYRLTVPILQSEDFDIADAEAAEQPSGQQVQITASGQAVLGTQSTLVSGGRTGALVSFVKLIIPRKAGEFVIEPVSAAANLVSGTTQGIFGPQNTYKRFAASSEARKLTVLPLPTEGQPKEFYGLVGKYGITAEAKPTKVNVGEPITLTVKITGRNLKQARSPELADVAGFTESFRLPKEQAAPKLAGDGKEFTQTIRATSEKVKEIPAIPLVYFDATKGQYVTIHSEPIALTVEKTNVLTTTDVEGTRDSGASGRAVEAAKAGISANYNGADALTDEGFTVWAAIAAPGYMAMWALPLAVLVISLGAKAARSTSPEKQARKRHRDAQSKAAGVLKKVGKDARYEAVSTAMKQYIGDRFDRVAGSLTADDCRDVVISATGDQKVANQYKAIIERCEAGRYAGGAGELPSDKEIIELIRKVERGTR